MAALSLGARLQTIDHEVLLHMTVHGARMIVLYAAILQHALVPQVDVELGVDPLPFLHLLLEQFLFGRLNVLALFLL